MNCIIVDDEYPSREELKYFINNFSKLKIIKEFENSINALNYIKGNNNIDVAFLDINMPDFDGMALAKVISRFEKKPKIIFVTAYKEYAIDAFEVEAFDYILKPYSEDRIKKLLLKFEKDSNVKNYSSRITFSNNDRILVLKQKDISCIQAHERKIKVFYNNNIFCANMKFSDVLTELDNGIFFQTHRSYVVNLNNILEIEHWFNNTYILMLRGVNEKIPVSRNYIKEFRKIMNIN